MDRLPINNAQIAAGTSAYALRGSQKALAKPDRTQVQLESVDAIQKRQAAVAEEAAKLFGKAHTGPDGAYFSYQTEVGAAKDAVRALVGGLLATNPYLIHQIEAVIHSTQPAQEGEA